MPETEAHVLWQALQFEGLIWLITAALLAGFVRGFSGFGSALIFMPLAGQFLPPLWCVMALVAMDNFGPVPNLPRAYRDGRPMMILWMILGMGLALPLGLLVLGQMDTLLFRYLVSGIALSAPLALIAGFRIRAAFLTPKVLFGVGVSGGFLGGISGMPGPPVIILHMASRLAPAIIRANTMIYLFLFDLSLLLSMALSGDLVALPVVIGLVLLVPSMLGNIAGGYIFNPEKETFYRWVAYIVTLAAAVGSLPLWD